MEQTIYLAKQIKQRKFLMILPLLTLPFMTLMFWAFGCGKGDTTMAQSNMQQGVNFKLPDAKLKVEKELNKLSFYQQATLDSAKTKEAEKFDPYWNKNLSDSGFSNSHNFDLANSGMDANQIKVYSKLDELKKALGRSQDASDANSQSNPYSYSLKSFSSSDDVDRLHSVMQNINQDKTEDPEITQLNAMLDKIQAIQNPNQANGNDKISGVKKLSVYTKNQKADISLLKPGADKGVNTDTSIVAYSSNGFYSTSAFDSNNDSNFSNALEAVVPETQTIMAGSTIKLALSNDITIQDITIPSGTIIYGTASLSNERLKVEINSIRFKNSILPVSLSVYDMDGQEGIYVPGSINRTVAKESANNALGGIGATTIDPSIGAQVAGAGIETAKALLGKKIKLIKVTVSTGYKVLLNDNHDK